MTVVAVLLAGAGIAGGLVLLAVYLRALLQRLEALEQAVWHVADELRGGVGLRIGPSRTPRRPGVRRRPLHRPLDPAPPADDEVRL